MTLPLEGTLKASSSTVDFLKRAKSAADAKQSTRGVVRPIPRGSKPVDQAAQQTTLDWMKERGEDVDEEGERTDDVVSPLEVV